MAREATPRRDPDPAPDEDRTESTRDRLVRAAIAIAITEGLSAVTTVNVCRRVGIAQSSYYTHFASREELLEEIGAVSSDSLRRASREARLRFGDHRDIESLRAAMRAPLEIMRGAPALFRLGRQAQAAPPSTVVGAHGRAVADTNRSQLADDLMTFYDVDDPSTRVRFEMVADCIDAMVTALAEGLVEGRYDDLEEVVDLLTIYGAGSRHLSRWLHGSDG